MKCIALLLALAVLVPAAVHADKKTDAESAIRAADVEWSWQKEKDGAWRVVLDGFSSDLPATAP